MCSILALMSPLQDPLEVVSIVFSAMDPTLQQLEQPLDIVSQCSDALVYRPDSIWSMA